MRTGFHCLRIRSNCRLFWTGQWTFSEPGQLSQYSVWLQTGWLGFNPQQGQSTFLLASASGLALGPTQPPIQWVLGSFPRGKAQLGRAADHSPHLVLRSRMIRSYTSPLPPSAMACSRTALLYFNEPSGFINLTTWTTIGFFRKNCIIKLVMY
jgi:hypothetical protein